MLGYRQISAISITRKQPKTLYGLAIICILFLTGCTNVPAKISTIEDSSKTITNDSYSDALQKTIDWHPEPSFFQNSLSTLPQQKNTLPDSLSDTEEEPLTLLNSIRLGFRLDHRLDVKRVQQEIRWLERNPVYVEKITPRIQKYLPLLCEKVRERNLPTELCLLPIIESSLDPYAFSHGGAAGLWQFIPGTAKRFGLKIDWWVDERRDPLLATTAALDYLEQLYGRFDDWLLAIASYNWGEGRIARQLRKNGRNASFFDLKVPRETAGYVPRLLAYAAVFDAPEKYGIDLALQDTLAKPNEMTLIDTVSQIDISTFSGITGLAIEDIYQLNPALNQWATHPDGPHRLVVPIEMAVTAQKKVLALEANNRLAWIRHKISLHQTLSDLALRYKTDVNTIKKANGLKSNQIRAGDHLMIPKPGKSKEDFLGTRQAKREEIPYTIQKGDSLWKIAEAYGVTTGSLVRINQIGPNDVLPVGRRIIIPSTQNNVLRNPLVRTLNYVVKKGDSLSRIASRFNVTVNKIANWNKLDPKKIIHPGKKLVLRINVVDPNT